MNDLAEFEGPKKVLTEFRYGLEWLCGLTNDAGNSSFMVAPEAKRLRIGVSQSRGRALGGHAAPWVSAGLVPRPQGADRGRQRGASGGAGGGGGLGLGR